MNVTEEPGKTDAVGQGARRHYATAWVGLLLGALAGAGFSFAAGPSYIAEVALFFPSVNTGIYRELTQSLKADPLETKVSSAAPAPDPRMMEAATSVLESRAALDYSLDKAKVGIASNPLVTDPVEHFRKHNIEVDVSQTSTLRLQVRYSRPEIARSICEALLDYYSAFIQRNSLTNTTRARKRLGRQLADLRKRLGDLDKKLTESSSSRLEVAGDSAISPDVDTMREIWQRRINEKGSSHLLLEELRRIRARSRSSDPADNTRDAASEWQRRWGSANEQQRAANGTPLPGSVRKTELPSRLQLERNYEENLLLYHAGLLQHSFLTTWEALEDFDYEIVDPVSVRVATSPFRPVWWGALGGLCGLLLATVWNRLHEQ
jgi:hypothetical protein